ncbi:hypothetical protein K1719_042977 [Acacia pycnantha]|nr:hypothetical protein K1719_042977 [Acacia pycnantha]
MPSISINSPSFLSILDSNSRLILGRRKTIIVTAAWRSEGVDQNFGESTVGENMIVLRKRIHEMKMIEKNYESSVDWMDWEKCYYTSYDSMICDALGVLQTQLMNTRPSLVLGLV